MAPLTDLDEANSTIVELRAEIERLRQLLLLARQRAFGTRRETIDPNQLLLFEAELAKLEQQADEAQASESEPKARKKKRGHGRKPFAEHLPREEIILDVPEGERCCPDCGEAMHCIGNDVTERGHIIPARLLIRRYVRPKYACRHGHAVKSAPPPPGVIDKAKYEPSVYAHIVTSKYGDHSVPRRRAQQPKGRRSKSCCIEDEGRPLGIGVQAQVSNHLELRGSRARVVSVEGNGAAKPRQVRSKKTSASEPLMTCREVFTRRRNRAGWLARDESRGYLSTDWVASGMKAA